MPALIFFIIEWLAQVGTWAKIKLTAGCSVFLKPQFDVGNPVKWLS